MCGSVDKIFEIMAFELNRQDRTISLIASENYTSDAVKVAISSSFTDKYAEGYPGKRYYGGCEHVDVVESYAIELAKELFLAEHANVQPHSGTNANLAVYLGCLKPGDTLLGMSFAAGGHLTHGHSTNISGKLFNCVSYGVDRDTELLDYDEIERLAQDSKPKLLVAGASAYSRFMDYERLEKIAHGVGALLMVDMAHVAGLVAAGVHPNPVPYADFVTTTTHKTLRGPRGGMILCKERHTALLDKAVMPGAQGGPLMHLIAAKAVALCEAQTDEFKRYQKQVLENSKVMAQEFMRCGYRVVSGGTDNHLFMIDLTSSKDSFGMELSGRSAEQKLEACGIIVNKNAIPFETKGPLVTSGIMLGTSAMASRGMGTNEALMIVNLITRVLAGPNDRAFIGKIKSEVESLCRLFPICRKRRADMARCSC